MISFMRGIFSFKDSLSPSYINLKNPKYIEIDGLFYSGFIIVNYSRENNELIFKNIIDNNEDVVISMFYERQDTIKVIKDLTFNIGNTAVNIKDNGISSVDSEIAAFSYNDAKYIRKEMQINNEKLYFIYSYVMTYDEDKKRLNYKLDRIESLLLSAGMICKKAFFRQEQLYKSCMPFMINEKLLMESARRNILTSGIPIIYPFISSSIHDEDGIFFGINLNNNSTVFINKFNDFKYKNSNMCILGASGSGKSFFTKLMVLRYALLGFNQFVIDPDREYTNLVNNLSGSIIKIGPKSNTFINVFDIRKESLEEGESGYLASKISKLIGFINLIIPTLTEEEKSYFESKIIEVYKDKEITFDDKSLLNSDNSFKNPKQMPKFSDLYKIINQRFKSLIFPFVEGSLKFFNEYTNVSLENRLVLGDIYELGEENLKYGMYIFTDLFWDKIKQNRDLKKTIYFDEILRLIGINSNKNVAAFIYKIFKTIRKYGGSGVAITQDISDFFSLDQGYFGRSIINNSEFKLLFSLEEENIRILNTVTDLSEIEKIEIKGLKKGESLMFLGREHVLVKVEAGEFEKELIMEKGDKE